MYVHEKKAVTLFLLASLGALTTAYPVSAAPPKNGPIKVFILAGQSNMEGQAVADLDGKNYNGGKGTHLLKDRTKEPLGKRDLPNATPGPRPTAHRAPGSGLVPTRVSE